jgi:ADP-ribose pyrophosphatase
MPAPGVDSILAEGKYLRLVRKRGWEYAERTQPVGAAFIGAITDDGKILLTREYRVPVDAVVVGCPAGLIGDTTDPQEAIEAGVIRELEEETGYTASKVTVLSWGPTSPGMTTELIHLVLAEGLKRSSTGGGIAGEKIDVYEVPLDEVDTWLATAVQRGEQIDPKVYSILYFVQRSRVVK